MRVTALLVVLLVGCGSEHLNPVPDSGSTTDGGTTDAGTPDSGAPDAGPQSHADGTVEPWTTLAALPAPVANHCAVAMGSTLILAGGNNEPTGATSFVSLDAVQAAAVAADGSLGTWNLIGHLPSPGTECVLAVSGNTLVLLGALFDDDTLDGNVWTATLGTDGMLTPWVLVGTLPYGRRALTAGATIVDGTVWLTDAQLSSEGPEQSIIASATLGATALGAWTKTQYWPEFRGMPLGAFTDDAAFILGGYDDSGVLTDVTGIAFAGGSGAPTTALPEARTYGAAVAVDGYVFAIGGRTEVLGVAPLPTVLSAKSDGATVGAWTTQAAMPSPRSNQTATVVGDWLFVLGGGNNGPGLDTVFRARVKHATQQ
jgi:hypothetical protein